MKSICLAILVTGCGWFAATDALAARDVPAALQPYMSAEEYRAAGLHKLNPAELAQFQAWFVRTMQDRAERAPAPTAPRAAPPAAAGDDAPRAGRTEVERRFGDEQMENATEMQARIVGTFNGWDGPTEFRLDNGQVWRTVGTARFVPIQPIDGPQVTIKRGVFNSYRMQVEGYNRFVAVTRIE